MSRFPVVGAAKNRVVALKTDRSIRFSLSLSRIFLASFRPCSEFPNISDRIRIEGKDTGACTKPEIIRTGHFSNFELRFLSNYITPCSFICLLIFFFKFLLSNIYSQLRAVIDNMCNYIRAGCFHYLRNVRLIKLGKN